MKSINTETTIAEGYLDLMENLNPSTKLDLISRLSASIKGDLSEKKSSFKKAFGAFQSKKNAEEIIAEIKGSRTLNRQIEKL